MGRIQAFLGSVTGVGPDEKAAEIDEVTGIPGA